MFINLIANAVLVMSLYHLIVRFMALSYSYSDPRARELACISFIITAILHGILSVIAGYFLDQKYYFYSIPSVLSLLLFTPMILFVSVDILASMIRKR